MFNAHIVTLFPDFFPGPLGHSITGRAMSENKWSLKTTDIRDFATDNHKTVDDLPYGGGAGMVMKPDTVAQAIESTKTQTQGPVVYLTPGGKPFNQNVAETLAQQQGLILLCGHYEGIDQRVIDTHVDAEISLGDFVLTGGEIAVYPVLDAIIRLLPGVVGSHDSLQEESFTLIDANGQQLVEYPHYTRPAEWNGQTVPDVLRSGNHAAIEAWRYEQAQARTKKRIQLTNQPLTLA